MTTEYKPRKLNPITQSTNEPIEFIALDWYECDLTSDILIEKRDHYLNQEHNKTYTIFVFGVTATGHSICLRIKNYLPYFYIQIPDEFTRDQISDLKRELDSNMAEDLDEEDIEMYNEAIEKHEYKKTELIKRKSRYYLDAIVNNKIEEIEKKIFWTFMNEQTFNFLKIPFKSKTGYQFIEKSLKSPIKFNIKNTATAEIKYNLFESDLEPVLRFMHDRKIKPASWIHIPAGKFKNESNQSKAQINISCDWSDVQPLDKTEIPPFLVASFDIEADSSHGDFPIAKKDCKKLANQLVITWIRDIRIIEKKHYEKCYNLFIKSKKNNDTNPINDTNNEIIYIDKKDIDYDNEIYDSIIPQIDELSLFDILHSNTTITANANATTNTQLKYNTAKLSYYKEIIKYIKAKRNIEQAAGFFDKRIKKALQVEQFKHIDDDVDYIYLKSPLKAKMYLNSSEFPILTNKIYAIANRPIRKVKANMIMKKAQKEVANSEAAKIKKYPTSRFTIDDLVKIINETASKYQIPERDLQDKIITKEIMVKFINAELNRAFGFAKGDQVIQIGTVFWRYGDPQISHSTIITLNSCAEFDVGDKKCEIISRDQEREVLLEWAKLIDLHDPDIIIGYNTFGFDESFMYDRITDISHNTDRLILTKEDLKTLDSNPTYQKFINLGKFTDAIIKRVPDAKGRIINKQLSSSALGDNFMYYFNTPGRVQIDLLKVCQASMTKLPSYTLDSVSEFYISGKIKDIIITKDSEQTLNTTESAKIKVENINEVDVGNYIVISMSATTAKLFDGGKIKVIDIDREKNIMTLEKPIPKSCLSLAPIWGLGKDDIKHYDIFKLQKGDKHDRAIIAKYCIQDCALLIRLLRKLDVINNNFGMANVCLIPFSYVLLRGQGIKAFSLITNECAKENYLLPVLERIEPEESTIDDITRIKQTQAAAAASATGGDGDDGEASEPDIDLEDPDIEDSEIEEDDTDNEPINTSNTNTNIKQTKLIGLDDSIKTDKTEKTKKIIKKKTTTKATTETKPAELHPSKMRFQLRDNFNQILMTEESYEGALVLKPMADIYTEDPITVLDFSSLYPSEMITSDLSHDRICEDPYWLGDSGAEHLKQLGLGYLDRTYDNFEWIDPKIKSKGKRKCGVASVRYVQYPDGRKGLIPRILMGLLASRKATKKKMEAESDPYKKAIYEGLQLAYKITANSVYGQIGARTSKIYKPQIAASTTAGGRERITHAMKFMKDNYKDVKIRYGDTDSLFIQYTLEHEDGRPPANDKEKIELAIKMGQRAEKDLKKVLPGVHCMSYEKVLFPFILISKKRYFALKYEDDASKYKQISMGLILKRRDNAPILKHCYLGVLDSIVKEKNIVKAIEYVQEECKKMVDGKFDLNMFVISKTLNSYYADPESIAHAVLAQRMGERDPGNKPQSNERIPYVFIKIKEEPNIEYLQGDRIEHIDYVRTHKLQLDYEKYILNQIMKPVSQLFELIVEKIPNFPYKKGYYDEMYNIWYNKYEGDIMKTEKKIKQLKSQMVQKLIFDPIIHYARIKTSKTKTLDEWFDNTSIKEPIPEQPIPEQPIPEQNTTLATSDTKKLSLNKIKKSKQLTLDGFFKS